MGICKDKYVSFLNRFGYNVVRLPRAGIRPLMLLGRQHGATALLGDVKLLIEESDRKRPEMDVDLDAAPLKGQQSSSLDVAVGLNLLGTFLGALGGNLGVKTAYSGAQKVTFQFDDVVLDRVLPGDVGEFLKRGTVNADNPVFQQYVVGNGDLFLITETLKSKKFTVSASKKDGTEVGLDIPAIKELVGGNVAVTATSERTATVTYEGDNRVVFGFACFQVGIDEGVLSLVVHKPSEAMALSLATPEGGSGQVLIGSAGLFDLG